MGKTTQKREIKYDILADWMLNLYCNFACPYCFWADDSRLKDKNFLGHENIEQIADFFDSTGKTWLIHMSGGEPFIHPRYIELLKKLTKKHYISINTNLTLNTVHDFIKEIDPSRVAFLHCALHYRERLKKHKVDLFIDKFTKLRAAGFNAYVTQVFDPTVIPLFPDITKQLGKKHIVVRPKSFRGIHDGNMYPQSYTAEERKLFTHYSLLADKHEKIEASHVDPNLDRDFIVGDLSWKGVKCAAGRDFVYIRFNGDIVRCHASNVVMGNMFEGTLNLLKDATACPFTVCPCPYYGLRYTQEKPRVLLHDANGNGSAPFVRYDGN